MYREFDRKIKYKMLMKKLKKRMKQKKENKKGCIRYSISSGLALPMLLNGATNIMNSKVF